MNNWLIEFKSHLKFQRTFWILIFKKKETVSIMIDLTWLLIYLCIFIGPFNKSLRFKKSSIFDRS